MGPDPADGRPDAGADADVRVGWLLRVSRWEAADADLRRQRSFVARLRTLADGEVKADASRISRWESGEIRVNRAVLTAYERVLDLPPGRLVATVEGLWRDSGVVPRETRPLVEDARWAAELDDAVQEVGAGTHSGHTWYRLADLLEVPRTRTWLPRDHRERLAHGLVGELPRSVGHGYVRRVEALRRLLRHPVLGPHVVRAVGEHVTAAHAQAVVDLVANLQEVDGRAPVDMLVRLSRHDGEAVRTGALWGLGYRARHDPLPADVAPCVARAVAAALAGDVDAQVPLALRLVRHLPREEAVRLAPLVRRHTGRDEPSAAHPADVGTLRRGADDAMAAAGVASDGVLRDVLVDALGGRGPDRRHEAGVLLMASPYRSALAAHALRRTATDAVLAEPYAYLLTYLVTAAEREGVLDLATGPGDGPVRELTRFRTLAHLPSADAMTSWTSDGTPGSGEIYALGMTQHPRLRLLAADADAPDDVRGAARWWLAHGGAVHDDD